MKHDENLGGWSSSLPTWVALPEVELSDKPPHQRVALQSPAGFRPDSADWSRLRNREPVTRRVQRAFCRYLEARKKNEKEDLFGQPNLGDYIILYYDMPMIHDVYLHLAPTMIMMCPIVYLWMYMVTNSVRYICSNFTKIKYHHCVENNWASNRSKQGLARQFFFKSEMPWVCHISVYQHFKKKGWPFGSVQSSKFHQDMPPKSR